ncbi:MAG: hypothetical protein LBC68_00570 [Prevotellaceae bacterium]|jgi:hypothetical protein|nr:hypothetical protein [Prevotellaceae bacterium]
MNLKDFIVDLCNTRDKENLSKWNIIWKGLSFYLLLMAISVLISRLFQELFLPHLTKNTMFDNVVTDILANRKLNLIIQCVLLIPVSEEIIFRLGLSFKRIHIAISVSFLCLYLAPNIFAIKLLSIEFLIPIIIAVLMFTAVLFYTKKWNLENIKNKYSKRIIYLMIFLFAAFHLINYTPFEFKYIFNYILIIIPHFIFAMAATYFRLNLGFFYSMLFHSLRNGYVILLLIY